MRRRVDYPINRDEELEKGFINEMKILFINSLSVRLNKIGVFPKLDKNEGIYFCEKHNKIIYTYKEIKIILNYTYYLDRRLTYILYKNKIILFQTYYMDYGRFGYLPGIKGELRAHTTRILPFDELDSLNGITENEQLIEKTKNNQKALCGKDFENDETLNKIYELLDEMNLIMFGKNLMDDYSPDDIEQKRYDYYGHQIYLRRKKLESDHEWVMKNMKRTLKF